MTETSTAPEAETVRLAPEAETVRLDWDLIEHRCTELGANTGAERAHLLGFGRASLYRYRDGSTISLARAVAIATKLDLALSDIVVVPRGADEPTKPPEGPRPPAGPPGPRPPAGPPRDGGR